jgi:hypothetical protein
MVCGGEEMSEEISKNYTLTMKDKGMNECREMFGENFGKYFMRGDSKISIYGFAYDKNLNQLDSLVYAKLKFGKSSIKLSGYPQGVEKILEKIEDKGFNLEEVVEEKK